MIVEIRMFDQDHFLMPRFQSTRFETYGWLRKEGY